EPAGVISAVTSHSPGLHILPQAGTARRGETRGRGDPGTRRHAPLACCPSAPISSLLLPVSAPAPLPLPNRPRVPLPTRLQPSRAQKKFTLLSRCCVL